MLTFQSVIRALYNELPTNGSELVLFDVNRTVNFGPLPWRRSANCCLRRYQTTVIANASPRAANVRCWWSISIR